MNGKKPTQEEVQNLMQLYPLLDKLMCETLLSFSEEELATFFDGVTQTAKEDEKKSSPRCIENDG